MLATVGVSVAPVAAAARWWPGVTPGIAVAISMFWVTCATRVDTLCRQLPDAFLALAILPTAMAAAAQMLQGSPSALSGIGYSAAVWAVPLLGVHLAAPAALGFGDVKAAAVIGAVLGLVVSLLAVAVALVIAMATAWIAGISSRRRTVPLGPFLTIGAALSLLAHPFVGEGS